MATEVEIGQTFVDRCVLALNAGELTAEEAAMAKWWCTELQRPGDRHRASSCTAATAT